MDAIYEAYDIEIPRIYEAVSRTGCGGCPYSRNCEKELHYLPELQRQKTIDYFRESYEVKGISHALLKI
jgi:hypothetical protein